MNQPLGNLIPLLDKPSEQELNAIHQAHFVQVLQAVQYYKLDLNNYYLHFYMDEVNADQFRENGFNIPDDKQYVYVVGWLMLEREVNHAEEGEFQTQSDRIQP